MAAHAHRTIHANSRPLPERPARITASAREEHEPCERGTVGCSIDHEAEKRAHIASGRWASFASDSVGCETW